MATTKNMMANLKSMCQLELKILFIKTMLSLKCIINRIENLNENSLVYNIIYTTVKF